MFSRHSETLLNRVSRGQKTIFSAPLRHVVQKLIRVLQTYLRMYPTR